MADLIGAVGAGSATVAGHDWGGGLAWLLSMHHPDRVQRLVVGAFTAQDIDRYVAAAAQPGALRAAINYYRAAVRANPLAQAQGLRRVDVPTLVIWGDQDRYLGRELAEPDPAWVPEVRVERIPRPATGSRPTPPNGSTTSWWPSSSPSAANGTPTHGGIFISTSEKCWRENGSSPSGS